MTETALQLATVAIAILSFVITFTLARMGRPQLGGTFIVAAGVIGVAGLVWLAQGSENALLIYILFGLRLGLAVLAMCIGLGVGRVWSAQDAAFKRLA